MVWRMRWLSAMLAALTLTLAGCQAGAPAATATSGGVVVAPTTPPAPATTAPTAPPAAATTAPTPSLVTSTPGLAATPTVATTRSAAAAPGSATPEGLFVVPTVPVVTVTPQPLAGATSAAPDAARVQAEAQTYFDNFYRARTLEPGGVIDVQTSRALVGGAYADYTIPLLQVDRKQAEAGALHSVGYRDIGVKVEEWQPGQDGGGTARVSVTRTQTIEQAAGKPVSNTATYQFRIERQVFGPDSVAWIATDFLNPGTGRWVSEPTTASQQQLQTELQGFFEEFYAARSASPGGKIDVFHSSLLVQFSYAAYTMPLLERQEQDVEAGKITAIAYRDIQAKLIDYDPAATSHGGIAMVEVTRTALVQHPSGPEAPQTATYRFRLHRHVEVDGSGRWLAVDFLQPVVQKWVSEIAGMEVPVPASGHG